MIDAICEVPTKQNFRVSIGMPVFNAEKYLRQALNSLLSQSFGDFELIISNNGSIDCTEEICKEYSLKDSRIKYYNQEENMGASWNFNYVFNLASGDYFMWAAHDDLWHPDYLKTCVNILDTKPKAVLCYTSTKEINEFGQTFNINFSIKPDLYSPSVYKRLSASWRYPPQILVFGLIRREILKKTHLIGDFSASDQVLVSELALAGQMLGIKDYLFYYRHRCGSARSLAQGLDSA